MIEAVCEIGPGRLRVLTGGERESPPTDLVDAALQAGEEPLTLLADRPVDVAQLWQCLLGRLLATSAHSVVLVHPTWWPPARVAVVADAARVSVPHVSTCPRAEFGETADVSVEIGPDHVAVRAGPDALHLEARWGAVENIADRVAQLASRYGAAVRVDAPDGVPGAEALGALIVTGLRTRNRAGWLFDEHRLRVAATRMVEIENPESPRPVRAHRSLRHVTRAAAAVAVLIGIAIVVGVRDPGEPVSTTKELVEGSIALRIPEGWTARRVIGGAGSDRVQVAPAADSETALHITQSRVASGDMAAIADALRTAMAAEPPGVFVDFTAADHRAGRSVVTYREVRPGHDIRWNVFVDRDVRISIGCQSAPGRFDAIDAACDEAVRSARVIG